MKILNTIAKVVFGLIILMPVIGATGVFPEPTRDMYNTALAYDFIVMLGSVGYITAIMAVVCAVTLILMITKRMALASILVLPITVNVVAFHAWIDGGLFTAGASLGNLMLLLNLYFIWQNRTELKTLLEKRV
jgi:glycerol-3-phosphate acyltransferase PlsY